MTPPTLSGRIITWLFVLVPLCTGLFFFAKGATEHPLPWDSAGWEKTTGTITGVSVSLHRKAFSKDISGAHSWFDADVAYQYEIDGKVYAGDDATFMLDTHSGELLERAEAEARARQRFPIGATVSVSYDPDDHGESTLQPGSKNAGVRDFITGAGCIVFAACMGWAMRWKKT